MKKLINKFGLASLKAKSETKRVLSEERGDTNFISIAIILVVVLALAVVFITFGKDLLPKLQGQVNNIINALR